MITCRQVVELLIDFTSDDLPPEHRDIVEEHLRLCPPCMAYLESYQITIRLTRRLPCSTMPEELARRLRAALEEIQNEPQRHRAAEP